MTTALADIPQTISDSELRQTKPEVPMPRDAAFETLQSNRYQLSVPCPSGTIEIWGEGQSPAWLELTASTLTDFLWLEPNWDSYGALPIDPQQAMAALELLRRIMRNDTPSPQLVPTNRGGIQVEWHRSAIDIEIETLGHGRFLVSYEDANRAEEDEWEQDQGFDWTRISDVLARLS